MSVNAEAAVGAPVPMVAHGRFLGERRVYFRLLSRDALAMVLTLGLYRFWVANDVRRYLWSHTVIAGDELEYTGDPRELFVGFMVIMVVLCPLFAGIALLAKVEALIRAPAVNGLVNVAPVLLIALLALLAMYQARRYRLCHTIYRGLRFRLRGSAWVYALLTLAWFTVNLCTLGLTYPLARKYLEHYKMRHTYYGDLQGDFQASARTLFKTGFVLWLIVLGPGLAILFVGSAIVGEHSEAEWPVWAALGWMAVAGLAVYPAFHANALRWRIAGVRFGKLAMQAHFKTSDLYRAYLRFFVLMLAFAIVVAIVSVLWQYEIRPMLPQSPPRALDLLIVLLTVLAYFVVITVVTFAYQATVRLALWRLVVDRLTLTGIEALNDAKAQPGWSPRHEGRIGGALSIGGF